jgi:hypothetical protein
MDDLDEADATVEARIRASIERDMADPEWRASMERSLADVRAGRVIPLRIGPIETLSLPQWAITILFWVAPWTWGRRSRIVARARSLEPSGSENRPAPDSLSEPTE